MAILPETLHAMHMSNNKQYEPQRTNNFEVTFYDLPGGTEAARALTLAVTSFSLPTISNDPIEVPHGNSKVKFAGQANYAGAETLEIKDLIGLDVEAIINEWHKQVFDPLTGKIGFAADYKKMGTITEFAPDGTMERVWQLEGAWPSSLAYGDTMSYESNEVKKLTMTVTYDRAQRL